MSNQTIRRAWPLYLAIAAAGTASIATSRSVDGGYHHLAGPPLRVDQTRTDDAIPFTIELTHGYAEPEIEVYGVLTYELDGGAPQDVRIALVEPGKSVITEQIHRLEGAGQLSLSLLERAPLPCEPDSEVCWQTLAVEIEAEGLLTGAIDMDWSLAVRPQSDGGGSGDVAFEVTLETDRPRPDSPLLEGSRGPSDQPDEGRWLLLDLAGSDFDLTPLRADSEHFTMRGAGGFTSSELFVAVLVEQVALDGDAPATGTFRLTLIPDEPATGPVAERVVTLTGNNKTVVEFPVPEPLDCPPGPACERGFTITLEPEGEDASRAHVASTIFASIGGEGEQPPVDAQITVTLDPS